MWSAPNLSDQLFIFGVFYCVPFLLAVVLPAWGIPALVKRFQSKRAKIVSGVPSILPFSASMMLLAVFANLFWEFALYNTVYYEWDRIFLPYTFFWHEQPFLDGSTNWIAAGWQLWHLYALWLIITILIYVSSAVFAYMRTKKNTHSRLYQKILSISVVSLVTASLVLPFFVNRAISLLWMYPSNMNYQEVDQACTPAPTGDARIFYTGDQSEWVTDLSGQNLRQAFKKHLQLKGTTGAISPDGTMAAILFANDLWVHCIHSDGAFKITLPTHDIETGLYGSRSTPSWSPDSAAMVLNNYGDLLLVDLATRRTEIIKAQVARRDNGVDISSKDRERRIPPFEFGDAFWNTTGDIYYTSFAGDTVSLHVLNRESGTDSVVLQRQNVLNIRSGDPTGKWLLLSEDAWAAQRNPEQSVTTGYLFNTITQEINERVDVQPYRIVWSPSGKYIAQSTPSWVISPTVEAFPATITEIETGETKDVSELVRPTVEKQGIALEERALVVEIKDFIDDTNLLITASVQGQTVDIPLQINGIVDITTGELMVLQEYQEQSFETHEGERIEPLQVIR